MTELPVQETLDRATLVADARWPGSSITDLDPLPGGVSSLTFAARLEGAGEDSGPVVIKVAPPGLAPVLNRDVLRQARILEALRPVPGVLVPAVLLRDGGNPPSQPPFFVMEWVPGQAYEPQKDISDKPPAPEHVHARGKAAARMLAYIQTPLPGEMGLGDEEPIPLEKELQRWALLFDTCPEDLRANELELRRRLIESVPAPVEPRVVHGDYRIGNSLFEGPEITAVIDWEIWSVGDPRTDLAWLLTYTDPVQKFHAHRDPANQAAADALPSREELLAEYLSIRPFDTDDMDWFLAYCYYKIASTTAAIAKRNRRREIPDPGLVLAAQTIPDVIGRGLSIVNGRKEHLDLA